ncbi:hypothetical protein EV175_005012 [Coemansia sp. RSA 1933]|nr:hypothetical protein EV175_005012 [Coemansia sp. RSA 1933]
MSERIKRYMRVASAFIVIASSAGLCLTHGIFESSYQFSYTTGKTSNQHKVEQEEEEEEEEMQSRYTMIIGALQIAGFIGAHGMRHVAKRRVVSRRLTVLLGAVVTTGGLLTAGFTRQLWQLCLTQGVAVGIGSGISYGAAPAIASTGRYILAMATGVGGGALALIVQRIFLACNGNTAVTLRWVALLAGGIQLVGIALASGPFHVEPSVEAERIHQPCEAQPEYSRESKMEGPSGRSSGGCQMTQTQCHTEPPQQSWRICAGILASHSSASVYRMGSMVGVLLIPGFVDRMLGHGNKGYSGASMLALLCSASAIGGALGMRMISAASTEIRRSHTLRSVVLGLLAITMWGLWLPASSNGSWVLVSIFCVTHGVLFGMMQQNAERGNMDGRAAVIAMAALLGQVVFAVVGICIAGWLLVGVGDSNSYTPSIVFAAAATTAASVLAAAAAALLLL